MGAPGFEIDSLPLDANAGLALFGDQNPLRKAEAGICQRLELSRLS